MNMNTITIYEAYGVDTSQLNVLTVQLLASMIDELDKFESIVIDSNNNGFTITSKSDDLKINITDQSVNASIMPSDKLAIAEITRTIQHWLTAISWRTMEVMELVGQMQSWESDEAESVYDYFFHDVIKHVTWGVWLMGAGFKNRAREIIDDIQNSVNGWCLDQQLMFDIRSLEEDYWRANHEYNMVLVAKFMLDFPHYLEKWKQFITNKEY